MYGLIVIIYFGDYFVRNGSFKFIDEIVCLESENLVLIEFFFICVR